MWKLVILIAVAAVLTACGGSNSQDAVPGTPPQGLNTFVEMESGGDPQTGATHEYRDSVLITFHWRTLDEIREMARDAGNDNWEITYGLSWSFGDYCEVYVEEPNNYWDIQRLYFIGHEMLHCWGWDSHD